MDKHVKITAMGALFIFILSNQVLFSQSRSDADEWLRRGRAETEPENKIDAFRKAIELDPKSIDGHFNLGIELRKAGEYAEAEAVLQKAYALGLTGISEQLKSRILYELARTYIPQEKLEAAEEALRGAGNLVENRPLRAQIFTDLAEVYFLQEKYQQSLAELERAVAIAENAGPEVSRLMDAVKLASEMERLYRAAGQMQRGGDIRQAKKLLLQINDRSPGFKDVEQKLLDMEIELSKKAGAGSFEQNLPTDEEAKDQVIAAKTNGTAAPNLANQDPVSEYTAKAAKQARPSPASTGTSAPAVTGTHKPAKDPKQSREASPALSGNFEEELTTVLNAVPDSGLPASTNGHAAAKGLLRWDGPESGDKTRDETSAPEPANSPVLVVAAIALISLICILTGYILLVPTGRARLFKLTGRPKRAEEIYERLLQKHPHKLWLYPALARLYDQADRRDAQAIRVYEMIQHLNFHSDKDNLRAVIAYKYLRDNEKESVTVEIVENDK